MICFTESELQQHEELIITRALAAKDLALAQANRHKEELFQKLAEKDRLIESLKQEAQIHAQEARTANHTIAEIYQAVSGKTGEPGNWHGAEPVKQLMEKAVGLAETVLQGHRHRLKTLRIVRASASIVLAEKLMNSPEVQAWKGQHK